MEKPGSDGRIKSVVPGYGHYEPSVISRGVREAQTRETWHSSELQAWVKKDLAIRGFSSCAAHAIRALDHHPDPEFPAAAEALRAHDAG